MENENNPEVTPEAGDTQTQATKQSDEIITQATDNFDTEDFKAELDTVNAELEDMVNAEVEALPEELRDIVPDLAPVAKLKWLNTAKAKGVFGKPAAVRTSDPDSKRPEARNNNTGGSDYENYLNSIGE